MGSSNACGMRDGGAVHLGNWGRSIVKRMEFDTAEFKLSSLFIKVSKSFPPLKEASPNTLYFSILSIMSLCVCVCVCVCVCAIVVG